MNPDAIPDGVSPSFMADKELLVDSAILNKVTSRAMYMYGRLMKEEVESLTVVVRTFLNRHVNPEIAIALYHHNEYYGHGWDIPEQAHQIYVSEDDVAKGVRALVRKYCPEMNNRQRRHKEIGIMKAIVALVNSREAYTDFGSEHGFAVRSAYLRSINETKRR